MSVWGTPVSLGGGGSGGGGNIDLSYLPNSDSGKVVASADYAMLENDRMGNFTHFKNTASIEGQSFTPLQTGTDYIICPANEGLFARVGNANADCTIYGVVRRTGTSSGQHIYFGVPYGASRQNAPSYWVPDTSIHANVYDVAASAISGKSNRDFHVLAISMNNTNKKARYFCDGVFDTELSFSNSGACLTIGSFMVSQSSLSSDVTHVQYAGAVSELESDATIIANMQTIMQKLGITG